MKIYCTHDDCRLGAAADLAWMSERLHRPDLRDEAIGLLIRKDEGVCRRVARPRPSLDGRVTAPLPPRKGERL